MNAVRAALWDMDGTLIDSEEFHWISWRDTMEKEGIPITREQFLATFGQRNDSIIPQLLGAAATPTRIERISTAKEELYRELVRKHGMKPLPGVATWLQRLHEDGWLQAIGSACAPREHRRGSRSIVGHASFSGNRFSRGRAPRQTRSRSVPGRSCALGRCTGEIDRCGRRGGRSGGGTPRRHAQHRSKPQGKAFACRLCRAVARTARPKRIRNAFD